jgi:hypothetical protein
MQTLREIKMIRGLKLSVIAAMCLFLVLPGTAPYVPSAAVQFFFWKIFAPLLFFALIYYTLFRKTNGKTLIVRAYKGKEIGIGKGIIAVLIVLSSVVGCPLLISLILRSFLSYPTKWFANQHTASVAQVSDEMESTGRYSFTGYSHLKMRTTDGFIEVLWPTEDTSRLPIGSCVQINARAWLLGSYIESISPAKCENRRTLSG